MCERSIIRTSDLVHRAPKKWFCPSCVAEKVSQFYISQGVPQLTKKQIQHGNSGNLR